MQLLCWPAWLSGDSSGGFAITCGGPMSRGCRNPPVCIYAGRCSPHTGQNTDGGPRLGWPHTGLPPRHPSHTYSHLVMCLEPSICAPHLGSHGHVVIMFVLIQCLPKSDDSHGCELGWTMLFPSHTCLCTCSLEREIKYNFRRNFQYMQIARSLKIKTNTI